MRHLSRALAALFVLSLIACSAAPSQVPVRDEAPEHGDPATE